MTICPTPPASVSTLIASSPGSSMSSGRFSESRIRSPSWNTTAPSGISVSVSSIFSTRPSHGSWWTLEAASASVSVLSSEISSVSSSVTSSLVSSSGTSSGIFSRTGASCASSSFGALCAGAAAHPLIRASTRTVLRIFNCLLFIIYSFDYVSSVFSIVCLTCCPTGKAVSYKQLFIVL